MACKIDMEAVNKKGCNLRLLHLRFCHNYVLNSCQKEQTMQLRREERKGHLYEGLAFKSRGTLSAVGCCKGDFSICCTCRDERAMHAQSQKPASAADLRLLKGVFLAVAAAHVLNGSMHICTMCLNSMPEISALVPAARERLQGFSLPFLFNSVTQILCKKLSSSTM